jgi:hypothetical protein
MQRTTLFNTLKYLFNAGLFAKRIGDNTFNISMALDRNVLACAIGVNTVTAPFSAKVKAILFKVAD